jgi:integrase
MSDLNIQALRAKERKHIPVVLTRQEVVRVISNLDGIYNLLVSMMYGCGLRMSEALSIRVKDIDFGFDKVYIWDQIPYEDTIYTPLH